MGSPPETPYHDRHTLRYVKLFVSHEKKEQEMPTFYINATTQGTSNLGRVKRALGHRNYIFMILGSLSYL